MTSTNFTINEFPFSNIKLKTPKALQGGTYSSEILLDDNSLVIQTPKCKTKNGIHTTSKTTYCDLLMDSDHEDFILSLEKLQEQIRDLIHENGENWFQEAPTKDEIEYNWNNSIRSYKQKHFLIRTFIDKNRSKSSSFKIFNTEGEELIDNSILNNNSVICILEIKKIKFSSQSFNLEIKLRQVMVIKEDPIFNKCLIHFSNKNVLEKHITQNQQEVQQPENTVEKTINNQNDGTVNEHINKGMSGNENKGNNDDVGNYIGDNDDNIDDNNDNNGDNDDNNDDNDDNDDNNDDNDDNDDNNDNDDDDVDNDIGDNDDNNDDVDNDDNNDDNNNDNNVDKTDDKKNTDIQQVIKN